MTDPTRFYEKIIRESYHRITALESELAQLQSSQWQPIAIVSMAVRFPGANSPAALWELLKTGQDAIREVPPDRWDIDAYYDPDMDAPGKMVTRFGGFLDQVDRFDAAFFKLSPREATMLDPQHRLLLEVSWEALERANVSLEAVPRLTGLFVGISSADYSGLLASSSNDQLNRTYLNTGNSSSTASGRLAHFLNVQGPTYAVDTACSSGLVAVHLAVQSLRNGECHLALAGGVNCLLDPDVTVSFSQGRYLSPDGRCKTFDAAANGYVRSEGCGMVVLKRLADAERDGDPILAVIRGSAVNHDGQTSGLTVPSGPSQQVVVRAALANARLQPTDIGYVEAHGTGTPLGDPIEVNALGAVFAGRDTPLYLGSIKTNMGHLEAAAGIAGLCKVVLALHHQAIPAHLHFSTPNPTVDWDALPIHVPTDPIPWPSGKAAGVSSFGFSGTNAHVILEAAPLREVPPRADALALPAVLLPLAAKTDAALCDLAQAYADHLAAHPDLPLADVAYTAATRRSPFAHRLALVAADATTMRQHLAAVAASDPSVGITGIASRTATPQVAFLFTGHGAQYVGMGRQLYATQHTFHAALDDCAARLTAYLDTPLLDILYPADDNSAPLLDTMTYSQPAIFAIAYALAQLWRAWGVEPAMVLGHSIGEYVAACVAGVYNLDDALKLVAARGRLMDAAPDTGMMATIFAPIETVAALIAPYPDEVALAAVNAPTRSVISGTRARVESILQNCAAQNIEVRRLQVAQAGHSPLLDPILDEFEAVAQTITYTAPSIPIVAGLTGSLAQADQLCNAHYWRRHLREPVPFTSMLHTLEQAGVTAYLEIGSHPMLLSMGQQTLSETDPAAWVASLHRERDDWPQMLTSLGHLYVAGVPIDWLAVYPPAQHQRVNLPIYPFQRERYWIQTNPHRRTSQLRPLLDTMLHVPLLKATAFETNVSTATLPWLADHQVFGRVVMPGAGSLVMLLSAAEVLWDTPAVQVRDAILAQPLVIPDAQTRTVQILIQPTAASNGTPVAEAQLVSLPHGGTAISDPTPHVTGTVSLAHPLPSVDLAALQARCTMPVDLAAAPRDESIVFGPTFRWLAAVWRGDGEALARLVQPDALDSTAGYLIHPALLDACFQLSGFALAETQETLLPFAVDCLTLAAPAHPGSVWWAHARQSGAQCWDLTLFTEAGQVLAAVAGFQLRAATDNALLAQQQTAAWLYTLAWREQPLPTVETVAAGRWLVVVARRRGDEGTRRRGGKEARGAEQTILEELQHRGQACVTVAADDCDALEAVLTDGQPLQGVLYLATAPDGDPASIPDQAEAIYTGALHLAQALVHHGQSPRLWLVTRGTHLVQDGETIQVSGAVLWGLGRTLGHEHPELTPTLIDLPATPEADEAIWLTTDLLAATEETQVAYRGGQRRVARLVRYQLPDATDESAIQPDASYLITGGLGGLGLTIARSLVDQGARHLILSGRSGATSEVARQSIADLDQQGATVQVVPANMSCQEDVAHLLAIAQSQAPLRGIIHAAGVLDDGMLLQQTLERYQTVAAPKVAGSWHLHTLTREMPLDFLVFFSSASSLLGNAGQANYAAANAFMDNLALSRQAQHLPALSINWGAWAQVGLAAQRASAGHMQMTATTSLTPEQGAATFQMLLGVSGQVGVVPGLERLRDHAPFYTEIQGHQRTAAALPIRAQLSQALPGERLALLETYLERQIARVLGRSDTIALDSVFFDLGMDSLMAVELRNTLQKGLDCKLPATLTFDYPTGTKLVAYLGDLLFAEADSQEQSQPAETAQSVLAKPDSLDDLSIQDISQLLNETLSQLDL